MQSNSFWKGSSPRNLVSKVASPLDFGSCMRLERAKGPGESGQYDPLLLLFGNGDGGLSVEQKYELLFHTSNVNIDVVVNRVAINTLVNFRRGGDL